ncbi:shikimate kinase [Pleurocapsa sp. PCC 7319]|uniref:shikimate kinase n=1 Tax=Pleurocapsa sp. PCC 7319 TaxID=118161 RepID=UPI0003499659|nr:shikimate kinase [Pleurocapsa sp. PCC 7319]
MSNLLQGLNIYLVGMMGSGKTTIGRHLAQKLQYRFADTDQTIQAIAKKSITEIFQQEGEVYFRELETKVLAELSVYTRSVISTGGGIIQQQLNWSYLRHGLIVWLDVDLEILKKRLAGDQTRPLADKLESLLKTRRPLYAQADICLSIEQEQTPQAITNRIIETIPSVLKSQV